MASLSAPQQAARADQTLARNMKLLAHNDLAQLADYVPATTLAYLASDQAKPIRQQLRDGIEKAGIKA